MRLGVKLVAFIFNIRNFTQLKPVVVSDRLRCHPDFAVQQQGA